MNNTIVLSTNDLHAVQRIELELLCEVRRVCEKNGIQYCIIAGTLLGAIRHGGFIPWDDDADVAMLRNEYERFRLACETDLDKSRFYFQDHITTPGYRWGYGKLRRINTEFMRCGQEHMPYAQGIFIDIFPLDNVPDGKFARYVHNLHCTLIRKTLWSEVGKNVDKSRFFRFIYKQLAKLPLDTVFAHYNRYMHKYNLKQTPWVRILTFPTPNREYGYLRRWYEEVADYTFEGERFAGIRNYDEYLTFKFGNWRELPPERERKTHPVSRLRLPE